MSLEFNEAGEVTYYRDGELVSSGLSDGHLGFGEIHEYFALRGEVFRAPIANPIEEREDRDGILRIRKGSRFEMTISAWDYFGKGLATERKAG